MVQQLNAHLEIPSWFHGQQEPKDLSLLPLSSQTHYPRHWIRSRAARCQSSTLRVDTSLASGGLAHYATRLVAEQHFSECTFGRALSMLHMAKFHMSFQSNKQLKLGGMSEPQMYHK